MVVVHWAVVLAILHWSAVVVLPCQGQSESPIVLVDGVQVLQPASLVAVLLPAVCPCWGGLVGLVAVSWVQVVLVVGGVVR